MHVCREAKIHDALLFFDECEAIFEDREKHGSNHVNMLLTEVEKHEGIIIMATNRSALMAFVLVLIKTIGCKKGTAVNTLWAAQHGELHLSLNCDALYNHAAAVNIFWGSRLMTCMGTAKMSSQA